MRQQDSRAPRTTISHYRDHRGRLPVLSWLRQLLRRDRRGYPQCRAALEALEESGHELRRPVADYLREGLYELRASAGTVQYRILYFFYGKDVVVVAEGFVKTGRAVPEAEIQRALSRKQDVERAPARHLSRSTGVEEP